MSPLEVGETLGKTDDSEKSAAPGAAVVREVDADRAEGLASAEAGLALVAAAWPSLSEADRRAILAVVRRAAELGEHPQ